MIDIQTPFKRTKSFEVEHMVKFEVQRVKTEDEVPYFL